MMNMFWAIALMILTATTFLFDIHYEYTRPDASDIFLNLGGLCFIMSFICIYCGMHMVTECQKCWRLQKGAIIAQIF